MIANMGSMHVSSLWVCPTKRNFKNTLVSLHLSRRPVLEKDAPVYSWTAEWAIPPQNTRKARRNPAIEKPPCTSPRTADQTTARRRHAPNPRHPYAKNTNHSMPSVKCRPHPVETPFMGQARSCARSFLGTRFQRTGVTSAWSGYSKR